LAPLRQPTSSSSSPSSKFIYPSHWLADKGCTKKENLEEQWDQVEKYLISAPAVANDQDLVSFLWKRLLWALPPDQFQIVRCVFKDSSYFYYIISYRSPHYPVRLQCIHRYRDHVH
jgi:hypothetical protein